MRPSFLLPLLLSPLLPFCGDGDEGKKPYEGYALSYSNLEEEPFYIALSPDAETLFVSGETLLFLVDPLTLTVLDEKEPEIPPGKILFDDLDEETELLYIVERDGNSILRAPLPSLSIFEEVGTGGAEEITDAEINPFRNHLYISDNPQDTLYVIDPETGWAISTFPAIYGIDGMEISPIDPGVEDEEGEDVVFNYPLLYIASQEDRYIRVFDTTERLLGEENFLTHAPGLLHLTPDSGTLAVTHTDSNTITLFSLPAWDSSSIPTPFEVSALASTSSSGLNLLFAGEGEEGTIAVINRKSNSIEEHIRVDGTPSYLFFNEQSDLYVALQGSRKIGLIRFEVRPDRDDGEE